MMVPPWVFALFFVEGLLLLFHVSIAIVVLSDVLSNKIQHMYVTAFSVLYLLQSVADWGSYVFVSLANASGQVGFRGSREERFLGT